MKKIFILMLLTFLFFSSYTITQTQKQALIFSIDVSKSMLNPAGFYKTLKEQIKSFIKNEVQVNDLITVYSFGDDVKIISDAVNFKISTVQDIEKLTQFIDKLQPTDNKTFLTKAIDILANQMGDLQKQYPNMPIKSFLFTDGKNDPPTGASTMTLNEILNKHKATFQNPYSHTYIITLGTKLDKELQDFVNTSESEITVIEDTKDLKERSVTIIPSVQQIKISLSDISNIKAKFQFLTIKNIEQGKLSFNKISGQEFEIKSNEISFNPSNAGKYFNIPISLNQEIQSGTYQLKFSIVPLNDNFKVIPKEVKVEIIVDVSTIELASEPLTIELSKDGGTEQITIKGNNNTSQNVKVLPLFNPSDGILNYSGNHITLPKGEFEEEIELTIAPSEEGESEYQLILQPMDDNVRIQNTIPIILKITEPFNWGPIISIIIIILIIAILGAIIYFFFYSVNKAFAEYTISGMSLRKEPLNEFKKFFNTKITIGTDIFSDVIGEKVVTIKGNIGTPFNKKLALTWYANDSNISPQEVLGYDTLKSMTVLYNKKYQFVIEKS